MITIDYIDEHVLKTFENIIFDLGGVIVGLDESLTREKFRQLLGLEDYSSGPYSKVFKDFETGDISSKSFRSAVKKIASDNGYPPPTDVQIDDAWNAMILKVPHTNIELLRKLSKKYRVFLLSNTNAIHLEYFSKHAFYDGFSFEEFEGLFLNTYYSHLIGARKPCASAYRVVIDENELNPQTTLFIDDNPPNFAGAHELGIRTLHLKGDLVASGLS